MATRGPVMRGNDFINAKYGKVIMEVDGKRFVAFNITKFEATVELSKKNLPRLDAFMDAHIVTGGNGKFSGEAYGATPQFIEMLRKAKDTLVSTRFTIQTYEDDPNYAGGKSNFIFFDCLLDSYLLAQLDVSDTERREPVNGTFDDFMAAETYSALRASQM